MMKKKIFFSKKISDISQIKESFFTQNNRYLNQIIKINKLYKKEKKRKNCKNCNIALKKKSFTSFSIDYYICARCNHLNGGYEESSFFLHKIYSVNEGKQYAQNYLQDYKERIKKIYQPKANFYNKILGNNSFVELGAGNGSFLKACEKIQISGIGYETNKTLVDFGQKNLKKNKLCFSEINDIKKNLINSNAKSLVLIGVIEHLKNPNDIFKIFKKSKFQYLFFSLPLFSFSAILENIFAEIYPRQLGGAHTHLYTKDSINYFIKKNRFTILAEWWFGQDFLDLKRSLLNSIIKKNNNKKVAKYLDVFFGDYIDDFQKILDKNFVSSEVHMIIKK